MSGPTPMRSAADKPHNPSSFPGQCRWPSKHIHSQPTVVASVGGAPLGHQRRYLLRCEYFFDARMNGGGCGRCSAWTM